MIYMNNYIIMDLPIELWQMISEKTKVLIQLKIKQCCKLFYKNLRICDFGDYKISSLLNDEIIQQHPYIKKLAINNNITTVNNLKYLDALYIYKNVNEKFFENINIRKIKFKRPLGMDFYSNKINLNHMTNLKVLKLNRFNEDSHISKLDLIKLNVSNCFNITNVNHLTNLQKLNIGNNKEILHIGFLTNLKNLNISYPCNINNDELSNLNLTKLIASGRLGITNFQHMTNLRELDIFGSEITSLNTLTNLIKLDISDNRNITSDGISSLVNLRELVAENCTGLKNLNHLTNLQKLNIRYCTHIRNEHIDKLELKKIQMKDCMISQVNSKRLIQINNITLIQ